MYKPAAPMKWLDFAIRYYLKIGHDAEKLASAYYYKGMLLYENGDVRNGVLNLKNAEFIAAKSTDTELRHKIFESLSVVNDDAGEFRMAISYAKKSLAESEKSGNVNWLAHAYNNLAVLSSKIGRSDRASYYLNVLANKTTVLWRKRDFESVIEYYRLLDADFVDLIDNGYDGLSAKYKFEMILEHINKSNTEIEHIMGVANGSLRSIRSRIKKKKL